jgi:hypothetical protein
VPRRSTVPERWERELRKLRGVEMQEPSVRERIERGPTARRQPGRERLVAAIVAFAVFGAAGAFAWGALSPSGTSGPVFGPGSWPVATVSLGSGPEGKSATLSVEGSTQVGVFGVATSPDEPYPYAWVNPTLPTLAQPLPMPMGSELDLEGDVTIKELLYGDAQQLDEGAGPDSGPIWADQPDFSEPYFLPWDEESERTYLKFFGTWADGSVLDVYFEVVFVAPDVDQSDRTADIVVTPEPMGAVFLYGGQRSPMGIEGGTYGNMSIVGDFAGFDEGAIVAKVPAGTPFEIDGEHLVDASVRAGNLPFGEGGHPLDGAVPADPGRYVLRLEVTWDGGSATFLHQIEVVEARTAREPSPSPAPVGKGSVVVDILRSSGETGDPEAVARFGEQEVWMCPDNWTVVNPDGTEKSVIFDCGQTDAFRAPAGTPITTAGDFAKVNVTTRVSGDRLPGASDEVPALKAGSILTLGYEVTWDDGSEASFWLLLTVGGDEQTGGNPAEVVVRIEGLGRSDATRRWPVMTVSFGGETYLGCTEGFEWTTADGRKLDEASGRKGSILVQCSYDPLFVVPPRTPIIVLAESDTEVFVTRTTTPMYTGIDGVGVSVTWPDGNGDFLAYFEVRSSEPVSRRIGLDCPLSDRIVFAAPEGPRIMPGGSTYITGNLAGFVQGDVVEQMTRDADAGPGGWEGVWQVTRDGSVIATVEFADLSGAACRGSGIGGA